jgi:cytochrome c oxidase assembly factor CtaG
MHVPSLILFDPRVPRIMDEVRPKRAYLQGSIDNRYARISLAGLALTFAILIQPIDSWANQNLTLHMFQHIGLFVFSAVFGYGLDRLIVTSLASIKRRTYLGWQTFVGLMRFNFKTRGIIFAGLIPAAVFYYWGLPANFDLAITNGSVHILEHICCIVSGGLAGASINAISRKIRALLLMLGFMMAGMMGSMMLVFPPGFYTLYDPAQNTEMNTALMLFGALGMIAVGSWFLKAMDVI